MNAVQVVLKKPVSVLVVLHDKNARIALLKRVDGAGWQSVTGSLENNETPLDAALREVAEETGIFANKSSMNDWNFASYYDIFPHWQHRYPSGVTRNLEHVFSLCLPENATLNLAANEHTEWAWFALETAAELVFSPSNRAAILNLFKHYPLHGT